MSFTERQLEIAKMKREGLTNREIAKKLGKTDAYVSQTLKTVISKIKTVQDSTELLAQMGVIARPEYKLSTLGFKRITMSARDLRKMATAAVKVAVLGPKGTNTERAAKKYWGEKVGISYQNGFPSIFDAVERGSVDYGIIPLHESVEGDIDVCYDLLKEHKTHIVGEITLPIIHCLLGKNSIKDIQVIASHPRVLLVCRKYLSTHFPDKKQMEVVSTAAAAVIASEDPSYGAIGSDWLAEDYDLKIFRSNIASNNTRFIVIGSKQETPKLTKAAKTSILVYPKVDKAGVLDRIIEPFAKDNINLTRITSRPDDRVPGKNVFFIDFEGKFNDPTQRRVLKEIRNLSEVKSIRVLGSYPIKKS